MGAPRILHPYMLEIFHNTNKFSNDIYSIPSVEYELQRIIRFGINKRSMLYLSNIFKEDFPLSFEKQELNQFWKCKVFIKLSTLWGSPPKRNPFPNMYLIAILFMRKD